MINLRLCCSDLHPHSGMRNFRSVPSVVNSLVLLGLGAHSFPLSISRCSHIRRQVHFIPSHTRHIKHAPKGHDSTFSIVPSGRPLFLPVWTSKDSFVAAGWLPAYVFSRNTSGWKLIGSLNDTSAPESALAPSRFSPVGPGRSNSAAFNTLKNADSRCLSSPSGGGGSSQGESKLFTVHQNTITNVRPYEGQSGAISRLVRPESMGSRWFGTLERGDFGDCEAQGHSPLSISLF